MVRSMRYSCLSGRQERTSRDILVLSAQNAKQAAVVRYVCCDRNSTLVAHDAQYVDEFFVRNFRGRVRIPNAEFSQIALKALPVGFRRIDAQHMNSFAARQFKTGKHVNVSVFGGLLKVGNAVHVVVVCHCQHGNAQCQSSIHDLACIGFGFLLCGRPSIGRRIMGGVDLKRTLIKP